MTYIIENVNLLQNKRKVRTSILVKEDRINAIKASFKKFSHMRLNGQPFIMTPSHIVYDPHIPLEKKFAEIKPYFIDEFIKKGCTVFLTYAEVKWESMLSTALKRLKTKLINSPIDYVLGVKIPIRLITPSFIRKCKRERVPVLFIEVDDIDDLRKVPWGFVREAMFPYNSPFVPIFGQEERKQKRTAELEWKRILSAEKIPFVAEELSEKTVLSNAVLQRIGIIPIKSLIHSGSEVSYNFYLDCKEINKIEQSDLYLYYNHRLVVTVHKGTVIRAQDEVLFRPGFGENVLINTPSFFSEGQDINPYLRKKRDRKWSLSQKTINRVFAGAK